MVHATVPIKRGRPLDDKMPPTSGSGRLVTSIHHDVGVQVAGDLSFEEVFNEILSRSNERKRTTVLALKGVLEGMRKKGVRVYRIVDVGRSCEEAGVLTTQAIRNKSGDDFKAIVEAFARDIGAMTTHSAQAVATPLDQAITGIADLDTRTRLRAIVAENKSLRAEVARLKEGFKRLREASPSASRVVDAEPVRIEVIPPPTSVDITPLERFISDKWLGDLDWRIGDDGALYEASPRGQEIRIAPLGFVSALKGAINLARKS